MSKTFIAIIVFIVTMIIISFACIAVNNAFFINPMNKQTMEKITNLELATKGELYLMDGDIDDLLGGMVMQEDTNRLIVEKIGVQGLINKTFYDIVESQTGMITELQGKIETLERRHLEVIRALAILNKKTAKKPIIEFDDSKGNKYEIYLKE